MTERSMLLGCCASLKKKQKTRTFQIYSSWLRLITSLKIYSVYLYYCEYKAAVFRVTCTAFMKTLGDSEAGRLSHFRMTPLDAWGHGASVGVPDVPFYPEQPRVSALCPS